MPDYSKMRLGKFSPRHDPRTLRLGKYLTASLPQPPRSVDNYKGNSEFGTLLNSTLGDCTIAAAYHAVQIWRLSLGGHLLHVPDTDVLKTYEAWAGYNPSEPWTDRGAVEIDILNKWRSSTLWLNGVGHNLKAYADPDPHDITHIKQSIQLFGCVYLGIQLPLAWQTADVWDVTGGYEGIPGSWGGHAVVSGKYDERGLWVITWGSLVLLTWEAVPRYVDEIHTLMSDMDWENPGGVNYDQLFSDLNLISS